MDLVKMKLASIIVHLVEFLESENDVDLIAANALMEESGVAEYFAELNKHALLPVPRQRIEILEKIANGNI